MKQVLKFGGSSVANADNIRKVIGIAAQKSKKSPLFLVVSALGGTTDALLHSGTLAAEGSEKYREVLLALETRHLDAVKSLLPVQNQSATLSLVKTLCNELEDICNGVFLLREFSSRTRDRIVSYGELLSSRIIAAAMQCLGLDTGWKDARELIRTDSGFGQAAVDFSATQGRITEFLQSSHQKIMVVPGFIASDASGVTTTLGRGGSDYTAAILAAAAASEVLEIWTDVSGMMTADPRWVSNARIIPSISYQEAMELSHFGAKVIYPPTIQPVMNKDIPVWIKNTFAPEDPGTVIVQNPEYDGSIIRGISSIGQVALLSLEGSGMVGVPGFSKRLFEALAQSGINVILITQGSSEHSICVGIDGVNAGKAREAVDNAFRVEIALQKVDPLVVETDLSILALVGEQMKSHPGISGRMFGALGRNGVNVRAIAQGSSERNISAVISTADVRKALNVLHEEFFESSDKQVNLFIAGTGNVGKRLMDQLKKQQLWLKEHLRLQVRVTGLCNSRRMLVNESGIELDRWQELLETGEKASMAGFSQAMIERNLRNSVFVDVTASEAIPPFYEALLRKSMPVVACNKIAASSAYDNYKKLKDLAREYSCRFLFETNVGAGLPVIGTLNDLMGSGDTVHRIEAVLSGTLNFVFNHYDGSRPFADVVRQAQDEGYTEPDPRLDLSGTDVMRKIMILAREAGEKIEMDDITCRSFLPASCMNGSVEDFYKEMAKQESHFRNLYDEAAGKGSKLKFVASYHQGQAEVGLRHISPDSDFYHLYGKDNIVLFYTQRYPDQPLVVKGAGAGAEVTASGVFADIIRATMH
ncbi:MAG: bifunctional aspartate kinase/homoserine dehydrogenase I [Chitinophagaceae bacterium]|jgi:aspartokinase/homoserine dehydrogenase 1|nr:bifunctional aspartate kinase/homoserine dehydrogenase I [Chitinophagaceae bacterium]